MKSLKFKFLFVLLLMMFSAQTYASPEITLEHTFDGYYYPWNFPLYLSEDDDKYFYSPMISADNGHISLKTYNEDYTLRENFEVYFSVPADYKVFSITFSGSLKFSDGTPFFIVVYNSTTITYGERNYCIVKLYDARNGNLLYDLGSSSASIQTIGGPYVINGKPSLCVLYSDATKTNNTFVQNYTTKIFSVGEIVSSSVNSVDSYKQVEPIRTYDINGRLLNNPVYGQPYIEVMSDGSAKVLINH